jgi:hypothetical protein
MPRATPMLDQAKSDLDELVAWSQLPDADLPSLTSRFEVDAAVATAAALLAIAEALHGVVYVANAGAV